MTEQKYNIFRFTGLAITVLIVIAHYFIPDKTLSIHPSPHYSTQLYGYTHPIRGQSEKWINENDHAMLCDYKEGNKYGCGFVTYKKIDFWNGLDITSYDAIQLDLNYEGPSKIIRIYLRNFNEDYSTKGDGDSTKFLSMILNIKEIGEQPVDIKLSEFTVAEWWVSQKKIRRQSAHFEVDNIVNFGVDFVQSGLHKLRVNQITLIGKHIKTKALLFYILLFWMSIFLLEGILRFYTLYKKYQKEKFIISRLKNSQLHLEAEREELRILSSTDPLTGICNRAGMTQHFHDLYLNSKKPPNFAVLLFDIDHFKNINDTYGHDTGDKALKIFSSTIQNNLHHCDKFARWGGEEFIMITPHTTPEKLIKLAEKLRRVIEQNSFSSKLNIKITISIGVTLAVESDTFEDTFKRADEALYQAKSQGRNCSVYMGKQEADKSIETLHT